ncbi:MAG: hypothetical protein WC184_08440 [Acidimicrobiia bacterium]
MVTVIEFDEKMAEIKAIVVKNGLTLERFAELGAADELDNPVLRELWLAWDYLFDNSDDK